MNAQSTLGARLRGVIALQGRKLSEFAAAASIPYRTLQNYVRDERKPGPDHLSRLARAGVDVVWLLTGSYQGVLSCGEWVDAPTAYALGDADFVGRLLQGIDELIDELEVGRVRDGGDPLRGYEHNAAKDVCHDVCLRTLLEKTESIQRRAALGETPGDLLEFILAPLTPEPDGRLQRAVAGARGRIPRRMAFHLRERAAARREGTLQRTTPPEGEAAAETNGSFVVPPTGDWLPPRPERAELAARISEYAEKRGISFREAMVEYPAVYGTDPAKPPAMGQAELGDEDARPRKD